MIAHHILKDTRILMRRFAMKGARRSSRKGALIITSVERTLTVPKSQLAKALSVVAAAVVLGAAASAGATSSSSPSPNAAPSAIPIAGIIDLITHRNAGLVSYQAHVRLDLRQLNFPWLHPVLDGTESYAQSGFTSVDFPHTPGYLKGITKVEGTVFSAHKWVHCYNISVTALPEAYVLHMEPKIRGEVSSVDVTVGRTDGQLQRFDWYYYDAGDHVTLQQYYGIVYGYSIVESQTAEITRKHIRAKGEAVFDTFQFNVPVPSPTPTPSNPLHQCDN
jgi:hypothetical protein